MSPEKTGQSLACSRAGRKPALAFRFVPRGDHLSHPLAAVEGLRREVAEEERALAAAMAMVQEGLAATDVVEAVRRAPGRNGQERSNAEAAVEDSLQSLLNAADALRVRAVRAIVDILQAWEAVQFLAAAGQFHLDLRRIRAIDNAIGDGIAVLSVSIGSVGAKPRLGRTPSPSGCCMQRAAASSSPAAPGTMGSALATASNLAPWVITVGASNIDRTFRSPVTLRSGTVMTVALSSDELDDA